MQYIVPLKQNNEGHILLLNLNFHHIHKEKFRQAGLSFGLNSQARHTCSAQIPYFLLSGTTSLSVFLVYHIHNWFPWWFQSNLAPAFWWHYSGNRRYRKRGYTAFRFYIPFPALHYRSNRGYIPISNCPADAPVQTERRFAHNTPFLLLKSPYCSCRRHNTWQCRSTPRLL